MKFDLSKLDTPFIELDMKHFVQLPEVDVWLKHSWYKGTTPADAFRGAGPMIQVKEVPSGRGKQGILYFLRSKPATDYCQVNHMAFNLDKPFVVEGKELKPTVSQLLDNKQHGVRSSGWDPEIFTEDGEGNLLPAFKFLPDKRKPIKYSNNEYAGGGTAYYDGFQAEFTTKPNACHGWGIDYLRAGLHNVLLAARKIAPKAILSPKSVYRIPAYMMQEATEDQCALGCMPSKNAYGTESYRNEASRTLPFRVSGGHIHFGLEGAKDDASILARIKALDIFLALPSIGIFDGIDDPLRREFYGRAGEYRQPQHGLEYRTLSSAWLCDPRLTHAIMDVARRAVAAWDVKNIFKMLGLQEEAVVEAINYCDVKAARRMTKKIWPAMHVLMAPIWSKRNDKNEAMYQKLVMEGAQAGFPEYDKIDKNWKLDEEWVAHSNGDQATFSHFCQHPIAGKRLVGVQRAK